MFSLANCGFSNLTVQITTNFYFVTFYVFLPYYLTVGLLSNIVLIIALAKQIRHEKNFAYQLMVACAKTLENVTFGLFLAGAYWFAGLGGDIADWFVADFYLMFITLRLLPPIYFASMFASIFLSVGMTTDRVFALWKPLVYKNIDHRKHKIVAITISVVISVGFSVDKYWAFDFDRPANSSTYVMTPSKSYTNTPIVQVLEGLRAFLRIGLVFVLIVLNFAMILIYKRRMNKLEKIVMSNRERSKARKEANKDLYILCVCQSVLTCFDQTPHAVTIAMKQSSAYWSKCVLVLAPAADTSIVLASAAEFFLLIAANRKIRRTVVEIMPFKKFWWKFYAMGKNQVAPTNGHGHTINHLHQSHHLGVMTVGSGGNHSQHSTNHNRKWMRDREYDLRGV